MIFYYPPKKWGGGRMTPAPLFRGLWATYTIGRSLQTYCYSFICYSLSMDALHLYIYIDYNKKMSNNCDKSSENYQYFIGYTTESIPTRHSEHHLPATSLEHMILFLPWPREHCKIHISSQPSITSMSFTYSHNRSVIKLF